MKSEKSRRLSSDTPRHSSVSLRAQKAARALDQRLRAEGGSLSHPAMHCIDTRVRLLATVSKPYKVTREYKCSSADPSLPQTLVG